MKIMDYERIAVTTTGGAGAATGSSTGQIIFTGKFHAAYVDYNASAPGTTDVTISIATPISANLVVVSNNATDGWYLPRVQVVSAAAAGLTYDGTYVVAEPMPVTGKITVAVAQADALTDCVVVHVFVEQ